MWIVLLSFIFASRPAATHLWLASLTLRVCFLLEERESNVVASELTRCQQLLDSHANNVSATKTNKTASVSLFQVRWANLPSGHLDDTIQVV